MVAFLAFNGVAQLRIIYSTFRRLMRMNVSGEAAGVNSAAGSVPAWHSGWPLPVPFFAYDMRFKLFTRIWREQEHCFGR